MTQKKRKPRPHHQSTGVKHRALTVQQRLFVHEYRKDFNAAAAARRAGYSTKHSDAVGNRLMADAKVRKAIEIVIEQKVKKVELEADNVLEELRCGLFADIGNYYDPVDGHLIPMHMLPLDARRAILSVETVVQNISAGDGKVDYVHKLKLVPKDKYLDMAMKHFGQFRENVQHHVVEGLTDPEKVARLSDEDLELMLGIARKLVGKK